MIETATTDGILQRLRATEATARLVGDDDGELRLAYVRACRTLGARIAEARAALRDLTELRHHRCSWNEDDYCNTCGADGRA